MDDDYEMTAEDFSETVKQMAGSALAARLGSATRAVAAPDKLFLYDREGAATKVEHQAGGLHERPRIIEAQIASSRAVAGVFISETVLRGLNETFLQPSVRVLTVVGFWPSAGVAVRRVFEMKWAHGGWELATVLRETPEGFAVWLWELLPKPRRAVAP